MLAGIMQFLFQNLLALSAALPVQKPRNLCKGPFLSLGKSPLWSNPVLMNGFRILKWERRKGESAPNPALGKEHRANSLLNRGKGREAPGNQKKTSHISKI